MTSTEYFVFHRFNWFTPFYEQNTSCKTSRFWISIEVFIENLLYDTYMEHTKICIHMVFWALFFYSCQLSEEVTICDILLWLSLSKTASMISTTCIHTLCSLLLPYTVLGPWDQRYKAEVRVYHFPEYIIKACTFCLGFLSLSDHSLMGKQAAVAMKTFGLPMRRHNWQGTEAC